MHVVVAGGLAYLSLLVMLRITGKRTLSRMNAFDLIITMAIGSIMGRAVVDKDQTLAVTVTAFALLLALHCLIARLEMHSSKFRKAINDTPTVLFQDGEFLHNVMRRERIMESEIKAAMHDKGIPSLDFVQSVMLGANGQLAVVLEPECFAGMNIPASSKQPESK